MEGSGGSTRIGFVDLLYAVLLGAAAGKMEFAWNVSTGLYCLGMAILLEDYLAYHLSTALTGDKGPQYGSGAFALDLAMLAIWYTSMLAVPSSSAAAIALLGGFFLLKTGWEAVTYRLHWTRWWDRSHAGLAVLFVAVGLGDAEIGDTAALVTAVSTWAVFTPLWWRRKSR